MKGKELWDLVKYTDFEDAIRGRLDMDEASDEEMMKALDGHDKKWLISEYFIWHGNGIDAGEIKYILDILNIMDEFKFDERTEEY